MQNYFCAKKNLENQGYSNVNLIGGGDVLVATDSQNKVSLFNLNLDIIPLSEHIKIEKLKDNEYKIIINSYETKYKINE